MSELTLSNLYLINARKKQSEMLNQFTRHYTSSAFSFVTYSFERLHYNSDLPITINDFWNVKSNKIIENNHFSIPDENGKQMTLKKIFSTNYKDQYLIDLIIHLYFHLLSPHVVIDLIHDFLIIKASGNLEIELIVLENLEKFMLMNYEYIFSQSRINYEWQRRESTKDIKLELNGQIKLYDFTIFMIWQTLSSLRMITNFDLSRLVNLTKTALSYTDSYSMETINLIQENFIANLESTFCWRYNIDDLNELCVFWSNYDEWRKVFSAFSNKALIDQYFNK